MKFRVSNETLAAAVGWVAKSVPLRPPMPILSGMLVEASGDNAVTLSGFDYEVSNRTTVSADILEPGRVLVSARLLATIAKALPKGDVDVVVDGSVITVTAGRAKFTLPAMDADEFPSLPTMPPISGSMSGAEFAEVVGQVGVAAGRDDGLPMLTGIRIEPDGSTLTFVATDRFRLAVAESEWAPAVLDMVPPVLVPARVLIDTAKSVGDVEVGLAFGEGILGVRAGNRHTTIRLLDVEFVKYRGLMPTSHATSATLPVRDLVDAIKRSALVVDQGNSHLRIGVSDGALALAAGGSDAGTSDELLQSATTGPDLLIAFAPQFLIDGLGVLRGDTVRMDFTTAAKPALLTSPADPGYRCIVMPARLPG